MPQGFFMPSGSSVNQTQITEGGNQKHPRIEVKERFLVSRKMAFFTNSVTALKTVVTAIGAGVAVWGIINLLEGYGNDNPGANAHVR